MYVLLVQQLDGKAYFELELSHNLIILSFILFLPFKWQSLFLLDLQSMLIAWVSLSSGTDGLHSLVSFPLLWPVFFRSSFVLLGTWWTWSCSFFFGYVVSSVTLRAFWVATVSQRWLCASPRTYSVVVDRIWSFALPMTGVLNNFALLFIIPIK